MLLPLLLLLPLTTAFPGPSTYSKRETPVPSFKLRPHSSLKELQALGFLQSNMGFPSAGEEKTGPGDFVGWYHGPGGTNLIKKVGEGGEVLFLRPTHGTPTYFVRLGDPSSDPAPALIIKEWTLSQAGGKTFLGEPQFLACFNDSPKGSGKQLYYGPETSKCSKNFALEVVWNGWNPLPEEPESTTTVTKTTSTAVESTTETSTCVETTDKPETTVTETTTDRLKPTAGPKGNGTVTKPPAPNGTEPPVDGSGAGWNKPGLLALVLAGGMAVMML